MTSSRIPPLGGVTEADAVAWVKAMHEAGLCVPVYDDVASILLKPSDFTCDDRFYSPEEAAEVQALVDSLFEQMGDRLGDLVYEICYVPVMREQAGETWTGQ